eukprot:CAMPEP_0179493334 /NCGR_PEP_ID=MMETSP0799-20121207/67375_1 /TAXON_ID=46947 /ORGANISM="Geminigera cryophila, Strain CCMP2564" /LENGTH=45 /DNA_ID= /DNA_START= /DNA_END= /DNA_ORIENTATION=
MSPAAARHGGVVTAAESELRVKGREGAHQMAKLLSMLISDCIENP